TVDVDATVAVAVDGAGPDDAAAGASLGAVLVEELVGECGDGGGGAHAARSSASGASAASPCVCCSSRQSASAADFSLLCQLCRHSSAQNCWLYWRALKALPQFKHCLPIGASVLGRIDRDRSPLSMPGYTGMRILSSKINI